MTLKTRDGARSFLQQVDGHAPTEDQLDVIMAGDEPSLVIAGAGAGKTKTMALRVVYHVAAGHVEPAEVLGLTFTKKAANELGARIASMLRRAATIDGSAIDEEAVILSRPRVMTYNSFASGIASEHGLLVGVDPSARLITDAERFQIVDDIVRGWPEPLKFQKNPAISTVVRDVLSLSASILDNQLTTDDVREEMSKFDEHMNAIGYLKLPTSIKVREHEGTHPHRLALLDMVDAYLNYKKVHQLTEFADQVSVAYDVLKARPDLVQELKNEHKLVLLDEYQDTSANQAIFLAELFGGGHNVTAVGDPNQAIYGWRGASADAFTAFKTSFAIPGRKMAEYSLSMAFRNKGEILEVANEVAAPLRDHAQKTGLTVPPLEAFQKTGGDVTVSFDVYQEESYARIAEDIDNYRQEHRAMNGGKGPSIAVLCRARSAFTPMAEALAERNIPYIEHGGQSAIRQPEALTVRGLLRAATSPGRGESLLRPLTYLNLAPADIEAVNTVRKRLGRDGGGERSFVEALDHLDGAALSAVGRQRFDLLKSWIRSVIDARYSSVEDVVALAIRLMGLDTEVAARSTQGGIGRASLAILQRMAAGYSDIVEGATLEAYLDWLDLVDEHEKGDDGQSMPLADLALESGDVTDDELEDPHSVTIMTIHGAKGLEWDYVAIPELRLGGFDLVTSAKKLWVNSAGVIPQSLRADAASLPTWRWQADGDHTDIRNSYPRWVEDMVDHENREVRRLGYVAMTRPRSRLLLSGYWYRDAEHGEKVLNTLHTGKGRSHGGPSAFIANTSLPVVGVSMTDAPPVNPEDVTEKPDALWPSGIDRGANDYMREAAALISTQPVTPMVDMIESAANHSPWLRDSLADLVALLDPDTEESFDFGHLTANGVVAMADDPVEFRKNLERPIPSEPATAARLGQHIHEYIASRYSAPRTGDLIDVAGDSDQVLGLDLNNPKVASLIDNFENLEIVQSGAEPVAIEAPVDVVVAGIPLRGTIDAVFRDGVDPKTGEERVRIVDWKTGRFPHASALNSRELQLHLYRFAWSKVTGMDPSLVSASFAYLGEKDPGKRLHEVEPIEEDTLIERISELIDEVRAAR